MALNYHGTEGSSLIDCCSLVTIHFQSQPADSDRSKTQASKKILVSPRVYMLQGNVKWVQPHCMV